MTQNLARRHDDGAETQREILQKLFDHIPILINIMDSSGRITRVNREWERVLGWTQEEISTQNIDINAHCYPDPMERKKAIAFVSTKGAWGDFKARARDGHEINITWAMVHLLDGTIIGIGQDISERKFVEEQLRALSANLHSAREEEGTRIGREIHDELGSVLTSFKWDLESMDEILSRPEHISRIPSLREKIRKMIKVADSTIGTVQRITSELRPRILDDLGLLEAMEWQAQQFQAQTGLSCRFRHSLDNINLNSEQSTAVFRILQEALTNVRRHAQATRVEISIKKESGNLVVAIGDNGRGIEEQKKWALESLGLLGMRERARLVKGEIGIGAVEGAGTLVTLKIPMNPHQ